jgi:hypothetical protein
MDGMRFGAIELEGVIDVDEEADLDVRTRDARAVSVFF